MHCLPTYTVPCRHVCLRIFSGASNLVSRCPVVTCLAIVPIWYIPPTTVTHVPIVVMLGSVGECRFNICTCMWNVWRRNKIASGCCGGNRWSIMGMQILMVESFATMSSPSTLSTSISLLYRLIVWLWSMLCWRCNIYWGSNGRCVGYRWYWCRRVSCGVLCQICKGM